MRGAALLVAILSGGLLWGCAERGVAERDTAPPDTTRAVAAERAEPGAAGAPRCPARRYRALIGQPIAVIDTAALPRPLRVYRAGHRVTADHRPERMNVVVGEDGRVVRVRCG